MMAINTLHQIGNLLMASAWAALLFYIWFNKYILPNPDMSAGYLAVPLGLLLWLLSSATWSAYRVLVAERAWISPNQFRCALAVFLSLTLIANYAHLFAFIVVFVGVLYIVGCVRDGVEFHQPLWMGKDGRYFRSANWVKRYYRTRLGNAKRTLFWGGANIPWEEGIRNACLFGAISGGKTMTLRLYMQSFLPRIGVDDDIKAAFILDSKRENVSIVRGINSHCPLHILSPFDQRVSIWRPDKDIRDRASATAAASQFAPPVPVRDNGNSFWPKASRYGLEGLFLFFSIVVKEGWRLSDVHIAMRSADRLLAILGSHPATEEYLYILKGERLTHSVMVTIQVYLSQFAPIAAAFQEKERIALKSNIPLQSFSIHEIVHEPAIVLLGRDVSNTVAMNAYNRLLLTLIGRVLLNLPGNDEARSPRNFFVLDEFHTQGELPEFPELITNGSGKGVSIAIAVQAYTSLQQLYGKDGAETLMGQIYHKGFLRLNDHTTASYAADLIGFAERFRKEYDGKEHKWKTSNRVERVRVATADELRREPPPEKGMNGLWNKLMGRGGTPLKGYFLGTFGYWSTLKSKEISRRLMPKADVPNVMPWKIPEIRTWDYADISRLGLEGVISPEDFQQHRQQEEDTLRGAKENYNDVLTRIKEQMSDVTDVNSGDDAAGTLPLPRPNRPTS